MDKIAKAKYILKAIGLPNRQQTDLCALSLLALAGIRKSSAWSNATNEWIRIHDIIAFINKNYRTKYAENSARHSVNKHFIISVQQPLLRAIICLPTVQTIVGV